MFEISAKKGLCYVICGSEVKASDLAAHFHTIPVAAAYFVFQLQAVGIFTPYRDFFRVSLISLCLKTFRGVARSKPITYVCQISSEKQTANSRIFRSLKVAHLAHSRLTWLTWFNWLTLGSLLARS